MTLKSKLSILTPGGIAVNQTSAPYSVELDYPTTDVALQHALLNATRCKTPHGCSALCLITDVLDVILFNCMAVRAFYPARIAVPAGRHSICRTDYALRNNT